jgi:hypothetical protein
MKSLLKKIIGKAVYYLDYNGKYIKGIIKHIGFANKDLSIIWASVDFGFKAFLVPYNELIFQPVQLTLFN